MKYSELIKLLKEIGCYITREGANHSIFYSPVTKKSFTVPRHLTKDVPMGTLKSIKRDSGLDKGGKN